MLNRQSSSEWACVGHVYKPSVYKYVGLEIDCIQLSSYNLITRLWILLQRSRSSPNAVIMLGQRLRRRLNIEPTLEKCTMSEGKSSCPANTRHFYNINTMSAQHLRHWPNIVYKCFVFKGCQYKCGSASFEIPAIIQSVCLQIYDQLRSRAKGFEL